MQMSNIHGSMIRDSKAKGDNPIMHSSPLLAFDTSTEHLSIALSCERGGIMQYWQHHGQAGAKASALMLDAVLALLHEAHIELTDLQAICFGAGPGFFTGLRTACSVAQGLSLGANVPLLPMDTLLAVAEEARWTQGLQSPLEMTALLDARMDEMYAARYAWDGARWTVLQPGHLIKPEDLQPTPLMAGNVFDVYGARLAHSEAMSVRRIPAYPSASALLRLAPHYLRMGAACAPEDALPLYVRDKVAKTTEERAVEKALNPSAMPVQRGV
jgi:tRNA threonylcarbamoyladenosine biosynthesis protein TsaB